MSNTFQYYNLESVSDASSGWKIHLSPFWDDLDELTSIFTKWVNSNGNAVGYKIMDKGVYYDMLFSEKR